MIHLEQLVSLLRPLGVYDLREGKLNRGELEAYGLRLDEGLVHLDGTAGEMLLSTAEGWGLEQVEGLLPYCPVSPTTELRREALAALLRIDGDSFTLSAINRTLAGCGIHALAAETERPCYVEVTFPGVMGIPDGFERIRVIIEEILPCHLGITYRFLYHTWAQVAALAPTFGQAEAAGKSWYGLATWQL